MIKLNHHNYYRLPWNLTDNSISWLEPTSKCNLSCYGCYRRNNPDGHKPLDAIKADLEVFKRLRKADGISIAGGDPLLHPDIVEIVRLIRSDGLKPIVNTNGIALDRNLLHELKKAGVCGFTFHVDSRQARPGWEGRNEAELNELRLQYARMLHEAGGISCAFNSTVHKDTMHHIPEMLRWANRHIDIVQLMVFILYREFDNEAMDAYLGPKKLTDQNSVIYNIKTQAGSNIKAEDIYEIIKNEYPDFDSCAYLNGTEDPGSFKWLLSGRLGTREKIYGYQGAKGIEIVQTVYHLLFDRYLAYTSPKYTSSARSLLLLGLFDKQLRSAFFNFFKNPLNFFKRLHYQSIMIIQPIDILDDGRQNMCDSCPDITVWNGKFVWSCRMEEQINLGYNIRTFPKGMKFE